MVDSATRKPVLRCFVLLLVVLNLAALGLRLWPWTSVLNLPGNGSTGIDPAVTLIGYIGVAFWIASARGGISRRILYASVWTGLVGGLLLAMQVYLSIQPADTQAHSSIQVGLGGMAAVLWGLCSWRAVRAGCAKGFAAVSAVWAGMTSSLIASLTLLAGSFYSLIPGQTQDVWKQYQGLAIGSDETQALVHTLVAATGYLL